MNNNNIFEVRQEIKDRLSYFYGKTDGTYEFPNSAEGDLLKQVQNFMELLDSEQLTVKLDDLFSPTFNEDGIEESSQWPIAYNLANWFNKIKG